MSLNVIIPMAGKSSRFTEYGFTTKKFLLPVSHKETMIQKAIETLNLPKNSNIILVLHKDDRPPLLSSIPETKSILSNLLQVSCKDCSIEEIYLDEYTDGPATTVYQALQLSQTLKDDSPIITSNSDQILDNWDCEQFLRLSKKYKGSVLTYTPDYELKLGDTDKHSFVKFSEKNEVTSFSEKTVLSSHALVGVHYFQNKHVFTEAYQKMVKKDERAPNGEFYLSLLYNSILSSHEKLSEKFPENNPLTTVRAIPLQKKEHFYPVGEPIDYFNYLNTISLYLPIPISLNNNTSNIIFENDLLQIGFNQSPLNSYCIDTLPPLFVYIKNENNTNLNPEHKVRIEQYTRGWFMGDFTPSVFRTKNFEVGYLKHKKDVHHAFHIHEQQDEYNFLLSGSLKINEILYTKGDSFLIKKGVIACPKFLEECELLCLKFPSIPTDKKIY